TPLPGVVAGAGPFDLDDVCAEVAEHHRRVRSGEYPAEVDDDDAVERPACHAPGRPPRRYTVVVWVKNSRAAPPCSLGPSPLFFAPPNGTCGSAPADSEFTCNTPTSICSTACSARVRSWVNTAAESPNSLPSASAKASSA